MKETLFMLKKELSEFSINFNDELKPAKEITLKLREIIGSNLAKQGWIVNFEVQIPLQRQGKLKSGEPYSKNGILDICAENINHKIAIEIDRGNKLWSLEKLVYCYQVLNMHSIWVRWRGQLLKNIPEFICVLDLTKPKLKIINNLFLDK